MSTLSLTDLDETDRAILRALAADATLSAGALGRRLGLSQPAAWRRIKRLQEAGAIKGRRLVLDHAKLGFGVTVFLGVKLATKGWSISLAFMTPACGWWRGISRMSSGWCGGGS